MSDEQPVRRCNATVWMGGDYQQRCLVDAADHDRVVAALTAQLEQAQREYRDVHWRLEASEREREAAQQDYKQDRIKLEARLRTLETAVRTFGHHHESCKKRTCRHCANTKVWGHHEYRYNGDTTWHRFEQGDCTCGLDAALARAGLTRGEEKDGKS